MYQIAYAEPPGCRGPLTRLPVGALVLIALCATVPLHAQYLTPEESVVRRITGASDKLEITTNTSRILTLDKRIPRVQVNNPELLSVTPLSATQVQVSAKKAGVTQVNLWDEDGDIHTVDVFIYGDVRELQHALKTQFPNSSVKVYRYSQSLVLTGFIDRPDYVDPIQQLAEDYAPKVINNIAVGGVQQVLLKVKIYEISRTKLRQLGVDIATLGSGGYFGTSVSGLLNNVGSSGNPAGIESIADGVKVLTDNGGQTVEFAVTNGGNALVGFLDAMQENNVAKILAEPNIVAVSGRPAQFNEGGEIPILIPQGLGNVAIEYKPFGTQVDFLPIVLGNGKIRLEVRPRISEIDESRSVTVNDLNIPALTLRQVDTAVEMYAGQTFAIAGLIQQRVVTLNRGIPFLADIPFFGIPFRRVQDEVNEIELLILVTPELVDAMDPHEVPLCGPGVGTVSPNDSDFYCGGKVEVADPCSPCCNSDCNICTKGAFPGSPDEFVNQPTAGMPSGVPVAVPVEPRIPPYAPAEELPGVPVEQLPTSTPMGNENTLLPNGSGQYTPSLPIEYVQQPAQAYQPNDAALIQPISTPGPNSSGLIGPVGYDND